jgi:hypothetical protein
VTDLNGAAGWQHGTGEKEIFLRYFNKAWGKPGIPYEEAVSVSLCLAGSTARYENRTAKAFCSDSLPADGTAAGPPLIFAAPQKQIRLGRMMAAGLEVFNPKKQVPAIPTELPPACKACSTTTNRHGRILASSLLPTAGWAVGWVASAKKEETALKRLQKLIEHSQQNRKIQFM